MIRSLAMAAALFMVSSSTPAIQRSYEQSYAYEAKSEFDETWGIRLAAKNITSEGLTLYIAQSGGTNINELSYGSEYFLEVLDDGQWKTVPHINENIAWDSMAYIIRPDAYNECEINWKNIYGDLPAGTYRISKKIMNFRGPGDFDEKPYTLEFEIK